jgi:hypothetical protein
MVSVDYAAKFQLNDTASNVSMLQYTLFVSSSVTDTGSLMSRLI